MCHLGSFVFVFAVPLWTLVLPFITAVRTELNGQLQVIGSLQPIIASLGDDVILPCHVEPKFNVERLTVEWSKPDLSRIEYVHLHRGRSEVPDMKIRSYVGRTQLFLKELKDGNISLKIMNVTLEDSGRFRCFLPKLKGRVQDSTVKLVVEPMSVQTTTTETPPHPRNLQTPDPRDETDVTGDRHHVITLVPALLVLLVLLVLGGGVTGYLLKHKCLKLNLPKYDVAPTQPLPV